MPWRKRVRKHSPLIAVGILAILGLWLWLDLGKPVHEPGENPKIADLMGIVPAEVSRIKITNKSGTIELRKNGSAWGIESPAKYPADPDAAKRIVDGLLDRSTDFLSESSNELAKYGLDKPTATVEFADSRAAKRIQLGGKDASGNSAYALDADAHRIFLVSNSDAESVAAKTLGDLRDKTILAVDEAKIQSIDLAKSAVFSFSDGPKNALARRSQTFVTEPYSVFEMIRGDGGKWSLARPWRAPADSFTAGEVAGVFKAMKAERFVDQPDRAAAEQSLNKPAIKVTIKELGGKEHILLVGASVKGKQERYARLEERRDEPVMLSDATIRGFDKSAADLRSRQIIEFEAAKATRLKVTAPKGSWEVEKKGEDWQLVKGAAKVKRETIEGILSDLTAPASKHVEETPSNLSKYGLDKPILTAEVDATGQHKTYRIGKKTGSNHYAAGSDTSAVFEVSSFTFDNLNKGRPSE